MSERRPTTERLRVSEGRPSRALRRKVADLLGRGEAVVLPTETVYGLAVRADLPRALERLRDLKGLDRARGWTWHVAERDAVERFESLKPLVRRLVERYWPGPLTLVLRGVPEGLEGAACAGWTGLRLPAHTLTRGLLAALEFPVVMTSANVAGAPPPREVEPVLEAFAGRIPLVLDAGAARLGEASGVLRVGPGAFALLREGLVSIADLRRTAGLRLGFCCTGNTCRSPMAEALARARLAERLGVRSAEGPEGIGRFGFEVTSFGVSAYPGAPASREAVEVLRERDVPLEAHRSRSARVEQVVSLDRVYCMTHAHLELLRASVPPSRARHLELLDPAGADVPDPIGGSLEVYRQARDTIERAILARLGEWA